ncbi:MAG: hypothetical protein QW524_00530 [Candidatus Woesearchaeota archaeon]
MKFLKKKDKERILSEINNYFGSSFWCDDLMYLTKNDKIYLVSKDVRIVDLSKFNVRNAGLYFGQIMNDGIRLSVEGSQLIGKTATKRILEADENILQKLKFDKELIDLENGYYLVRFRGFFLGCIFIKSKTFYNYIPKARRNW